MPLSSSCQEEWNSFLGRGVSIKEELFVCIFPDLKYHLIYQEKHSNETIPVGFILSRNAMQISKAEKVSKGMAHQHTLGLKSFNTFTSNASLFSRKEMDFFLRETMKEVQPTCFLNDWTAELLRNNASKINDFLLFSQTSWLSQLFEKHFTGLWNSCHLN